MNKKKMTDNEIIKTLECCVKSKRCRECPLYEMHAATCLQNMQANALDLINSQKAEIERLQLEVEAVNELINPLPFKSNLDRAIETAKSEAIKEFAERLKAKKQEVLTSVNVCRYAVTESNIDNLVKEMTEEKNNAEEI